MAMMKAAAWRCRAGAAVAALALCPVAQALTFAETYEAARTYDAAYRLAGRERDAVQLNVPIARAALLPSVTLSAGDASVQGSRQFPNGLNQEVRTRLEYTAPQASLQLRLSVFNYEAISSLRQAHAQSAAADEIFRAQGTDLMDRLAGAYLQVLLSQETGRLAEIQVISLETQLTQQTQREEHGEGTRVQVAQAQAALDVGRTRLLDARDQIDLAQRSLTRLTGQPSASLPPLPAEPTPIGLFPERLGDWIEIGLRQSPSLKARERNVDAAREGVRRQFAGHLPRVDLVSSVSRTESDSINTIGQTVTLRSVGVQMSLPIFNGGGVDASVRQAESRRLGAEEDARNERESVEVDIQKYYLAVVSGVQKIRANQTAVASSALAWDGARRALERGLGTLNEVADAQSVHFTARRDLVQARVDQLVSLARLKIRAGLPLSEVANDLDGLLLTRADDGTTASKP